MPAITVEQTERLDYAELMQLARARHDELEQLARDHARRFDRFQPDATGIRWDWSDQMDGAEAVYIARQLEFIREQIYMVQYPELKARRLMSFNTSLDAGTEQFTARAMDLAGDVTVSKDQPDDVPMIEMKVTSGTQDMFSMVSGYQYSDQEARAAMLARVPLPAAKAKGVREIMARKLDTIAFIGEKVSGIKGLATSTGTTTYTPLATATDGTGSWKKKSADDVLSDLNGAGNAILTATDDIEQPDTWLLPLTGYTDIQQKRVGDGTSTTILSYFRDNNDMVKTIERTHKLETAPNSEWTGRRMITYRNDSSKFEIQVPLEFEQKQPQLVGFKVKVYCHMRVGGISLYIPKSVCMTDNF